MAQVGVGVGGQHLGAHHAVAAVGTLLHQGGVQGTGKAGPAAAAGKLVGREEEGPAGGDVYIDPRPLLLPIGVAEGRLGALLLGNGVLLGSQAAGKLLPGGKGPALVRGGFCLPGLVKQAGIQVAVPVGVLHKVPLVVLLRRVEIA